MAVWLYAILTFGKRAKKNNFPQKIVRELNKKHGDKDADLSPHVF